MFVVTKATKWDDIVLFPTKYCCEYNCYRKMIFEIAVHLYK